MIFGITVIVAYSIFISVYTGLKKDGHYRLFDKRILRYIQ